MQKEKIDRFVAINSIFTTYFGIGDLETLSDSSSHFLDCQYCNSHNTNLMPVLPSEPFKMEYNVTRGMEIEFCNSTNVSVRQQSGEFQLAI